MMYSSESTRRSISGTETCPRCDGTGEFRRGRFVGKCFACDGTGYANTDASVNTGRRVESSSQAVMNNPMPMLTAWFEALSSAKRAGLGNPKLRCEGFTFSLARKFEDDSVIYVQAVEEDGSQSYLGKLLRKDNSLVTIGVRDMDLVKSLRMFLLNNEPQAAAVAYGRKTGVCSCCGRGLTNAESIRLGIGPICREKFGWLSEGEFGEIAEEIVEEGESDGADVAAEVEAAEAEDQESERVEEPAVEEPTGEASAERGDESTESTNRTHARASSIFARLVKG